MKTTVLAGHSGNLLIVLAIGLLTSCSENNGKVDESRASAEARLEAAIADFLEQRPLPSLSVAVMADGQTVLKRAYGLADVDSETQASVHTLYPIGSIEKQFTAAAVMRLAENGKLQVDDPITNYLPRLFTGGETVTIAQMLHQVSGLQDFSTLPDSSEIMDSGPGPWGAVPDVAVGSGFQSREDIGVFAGQPLYFRPGERFSYSQPNYDLLCYVIAEMSGQTYYEAIAELAATAGLESFHAAWTPRPSGSAGDVATGYIMAEAKLEVEWEPNIGSAWTTAEDLAKWSSHLESGRVISNSSYQQMTSAASLNDGGTWPYGYGLELQSFDGRRKYMHTGRVSGFYAVLARYPDEDLSIALMTNLGGASEIAFELEPRIARLLLDLESPVALDIPLSPEEQSRFTGVYDAGAFVFEVIPDGNRIVLLMLSAEQGGGETYSRTALYYQGAGQFVSPGGPEWNAVRFSGNDGPAQELAIGHFAQAIRRQ